MGEPARKLERKNANISSSTSFDEIEKTYTEELVIGICGQIGTDLNLVCDTISTTLKDVFAYDVEIIKISQYFIYNKVDEYDSQYDRKVDGIDKGNELCETYGNQYFAEQTISQIARDRVADTSDANIRKHKFTSRRKCFIINSIKRVEEYKLFKEIYRDIFYLIGVFSPLNLRERYLKNNGIDQPEISHLIRRDASEDLEYGQNVENTFKESDYFIRISSEERNHIEPKIRRFIDLIFESKVITPNKNEIAMHQAASAALNSACLSRQVGAAITDCDGNLLSIGWNDVPKYNGGLYSIEDDEDQRCYNFRDGKCLNDIEKNAIIDSVVNSIKNFHDEIQKNKLAELLSDSPIDNLIEFSRAIHAEMNAMIKASQKTGVKIVGGNLYCTTYPCHNCVRHLIAAGIANIYYIEPYKKSKGIDLHSDAISENENQPDSVNKVKILMYEGVAPKSFLKLFKSGLIKRKRKFCEGRIDLTKITLKHSITLRALHQLEAIVEKQIEDKS